MSVVQFRTIDSPVGLLTLAGKDHRLMHPRGHYGKDPRPETAITVSASRLETAGEGPMGLSTLFSHLEMANVE